MRVSKKTPKSKPAAKRAPAAASTTPQVSGAQVRSVAVSVCVESDVSTVAKKSRRTIGEQPSGDVKINIVELGKRVWVR